MEEAKEVQCATTTNTANGQVFYQKLALTLFAAIVFSIFWVWIVIAILIFFFWPLLAVVICYVTYIWAIGFKPAEGMSWPKRRYRIWQHMADYFPAKLHKTADLDPKKTYIFAMVPHGIIGLSSWVHFGPEATNFSTLFPGIHMRVLTLSHWFTTPGTREYTLSCGLRLASKRGIKNILGSGPGSAVLLVPGGAAEALLAAPGTLDLYTAKRKGFVKLAIETGSSLVPVVAFGENEAFDTYIPERGSWPEKVLQTLKKKCGFSTPLFWGVGYWKGSWGIMPKRVPLNTVVGDAIDVPEYHAESANDEKMTALVEEYHGRFLTALRKVWDEHKEKYAASRKKELCFVT